MSRDISLTRLKEGKVMAKKGVDIDEKAINRNEKLSRNFLHFYLVLKDHYSMKKMENNHLRSLRSLYASTDHI